VSLRIETERRIRVLLVSLLNGRTIRTLIGTAIMAKLFALVACIAIMAVAVNATGQTSDERRRRNSGIVSEGRTWRDAHHVMISVYRCCCCFCWCCFRFTPFIIAASPSGSRFV
jgi:ABC-type Fe3+ transport system permease subunit